MATTANYTPEQTQQLVEAYQAGTAVEQLALTLGRSTRSVVAKLAREGVYQAKTAATSSRVATKLQLTQQLEAKLGLAPETLVSLEKATHAALIALVAAVA